MGIVQRDSFSITIIAYVGAVIGFINKLFLFTNFLTTEQVGLANLLITIAMLYTQFAAIGSYNTINKYFPFFNNQHKHHHGFLFGISALALAGFIISTLLFLVLRKPFQWHFEANSPLLVEYMPYLIPLALATLYYNIFDTYLRSLYYNIIPSLTYEVILRIFVTLSISLFAIGWVDFKTFVAIYVIANCLPAVIVILYTWYIRQLMLKPMYTLHWKRLGSIMVVYGLFSMMNNLSGLFTMSIDSLMVARMIDLSAAGIYTTMIFITSVLIIPYRSMIKVSTPLISNYWKERALDKMEDLYTRATASNLVVGSGLFLMLWINIDSILYFMPGEYATGKYVFLMLGIGKLFDMASGLNSVILATSKKYRYDLIFTVGLVVFTIITNYFFIRLFGMNGAALASMITIVLFNLIRIWFISYHFNLQPFRTKQLWVPAILLVCMMLSAAIQQVYNVFVDLVVRSTIIGLLFVIPLYFLHISEDINKMARKNILWVWRWIRKDRLHKQ